MILRVFSVALIGLILLGCSNNDVFSGDVYRDLDVKKVQKVSYGIVRNVRLVQIQSGDDSNGIGALGGAVLGGFIGNTLGGGTGHSLATAAGVIAGGMAGQSLQGAMNKTQGVELEICKDNGEVILIVQKQGNTRFSVGQRVLLATKGKQLTVSAR